MEIQGLHNENLRGRSLADLGHCKGSLGLLWRQLELPVQQHLNILSPTLFKHFCLAGRKKI